MAINFRFEYSYQTLPSTFYEENTPSKVPKPQLLLWNDELAKSLGIERQNDKQSVADMLSGNSLPKGAKPLSQAYAGHQFGQLTMLGDGRAHLLGEHRTRDGRMVDIQLKGSGRTRFSRNGDGRAALGPMLREYLMSEALCGLGIQTTRSLAVCLTGDIVHRQTLLPGAVLTRVAGSHIRVGTFEYAAICDDVAKLKAIADYTICRHEPDLVDHENPYLALVDRVMQKQIDLVVDWIRVGFIHGVMNTDNTAISGETIDYGPCAMMDQYHSDTVFSSIDHQRRYAFGRQSQMIHWNMARFAEALLPLIDDKRNRAIELSTEVIGTFPERFISAQVAMYQKKLGCVDGTVEDEKLIRNLLELMEKNNADYTLTFRDLMKERKISEFFMTPDGASWLNSWSQRLSVKMCPSEESHDLMRSSNPAVIPRNYWIESALAQAQDGDLSLCHELIAAFRDPYSEYDKFQKFVNLPPHTQHVYQTFCGT